MRGTPTIAAGAVDVARSAFVARAGDRRLFTGAAPPARIFLALSVENIQYPEKPSLNSV